MRIAVIKTEDNYCTNMLCVIFLNIRITFPIITVKKKEKMGTTQVSEP